MRLTKRDVERLVYSAKDGRQQILWDNDGTVTGSESLVCENPYEANRMIQQLSKMFEFAKEQGYIADQTFNVTRGVKTFAEIKRDRWVTPEELPLLAKAINEESNVYGRFGLWLYLLTGLRRDELLKIRNDIDL